jgi:uncharacterized protein (DUF2147 family)
LDIFFQKSKKNSEGKKLFNRKNKKFSLKFLKLTLKKAEMDLGSKIWNKKQRVGSWKLENRGKKYEVRSPKSEDIRLKT